MTDQDRALDEDLSALLDGELSPEHEAELRARVEQDPQLERRLQEFEAVAAELRELPAVEPSAGFKERFKERFQHQVELEGAPENLRSFSARRRRAAWIGGLAAAAAASFVLYRVLVPAVQLQPASVAIASELEAATDEEIGIALEYDTLADLELIEELDVLELMSERG